MSTYCIYHVICTHAYQVRGIWAPTYQVYATYIRTSLEVQQTIDVHSYSPVPGTTPDIIYIRVCMHTWYHIFYVVPGRTASFDTRLHELSVRGTPGTRDRTWYMAVCTCGVLLIWHAHCDSLLPSVDLYIAPGNASSAPSETATPHPAP